MFKKLKNKIVRHFKNSKLNFYIKNLTWNISFWSKSKKEYMNIHYSKDTTDYTLNEFMKPIYKKKQEIRKRFVGYRFKGKIYLDNPGMEIKDRDQWNSWRKKKLIK